MPKVFKGDLKEQSIDSNFMEPATACRQALFCCSGLHNCCIAYESSMHMASVSTSERERESKVRKEQNRHMYRLHKLRMDAPPTS